MQSEWATAVNDSLHDTLDLLTNWLIGPDVLHDLPGHGKGVVNYVKPDGHFDAFYPEIGGYYLQFLAVAAADASAPGALEDQRACETARAVVAWLDWTGPGGDPLTLQHRDPADRDWRGECVFTFDLGMILRGFAAVEARWPGTVGPALRARYVASVASNANTGLLLSHRIRADAKGLAIPEKWSTTPDVHHVKAAAALAGSAESSLGPAIEGSLAEQAEALRREGAQRLRDLHPFLYLVEGWLMLWGISGNRLDLDRAAEAFGFVLDEVDTTRGILPPIRGRWELPPRSDVLAQALRAGLILHRAGALSPAAEAIWSHAQDALLEALVARATPDGAIIFDRVGGHRNVWASLFAWQALRLQAQAETFDSRREASLLI